MAATANKPKRGGRRAPAVPSEPAAELSIGQLARQSGLSTATIHYYVQVGLLPRARKLNRTRAAYTTRHLRLLRLVRRMQAIGYSLEQVKVAFRTMGTDEAALTKAEAIGALQPLPPPKTDVDQTPIELFDPIDRAAFLARAGCSEQVLDALLERGMVRPLRPDRFDARDLWLVRTIVALLRDGVALDELGVLVDLIGVARALRPIVQRRIERHREALRTRALRFTDLVEPFGATLVYWVDRFLTEADPEWRQRMIAAEP